MKRNNMFYYIIGDDRHLNKIQSIQYAKTSSGREPTESMAAVHNITCIYILNIFIHTLAVVQSDNKTVSVLLLLLLCVYVEGRGILLPPQPMLAYVCRTCMYMCTCAREIGMYPLLYTYWIGAGRVQTVVHCV